MAAYDVLGNIAIVKFRRGVKSKEKKKYAAEFLQTHKGVRTVLEKSDRFKGRLRTLSTKFIAGEKTKEALYKENGCVFRLNVESCYFSPRLSSERAEVASMIKKGEKVLVMFGGVAPFAIVIARTGRAGRIVSMELGRDCCKYALQNVKLNKVKVEIVQGDVRRVLQTPLSTVNKISGVRKKMHGMGKKVFDRIVMARPNLKDSFLDVSFPYVKKGGIIHYYGFYLETEKDKMIEMIMNQAKKAKRKIKILGVKKAGDIGVKKYRYRVDLKVLN